MILPIRDKKNSLAYNKTENFFNFIRNEIKNSNRLYGKEDAVKLKDYYPNIQDKKPYFRYIRHYYALRVMHLIRNIKKNKKILDVGCGTGSEAILCGIFGGKVTGIDIDGHRINIAKKRVKYFEHLLEIKIDIDFFIENVFEHSGKYDLVWVNEAISHITPIEKFLKICHSFLNVDGKLIIADSNKINPYSYIHSKKEQKKARGIYVTKFNSKTGKQIPYAVERIFSIPNIKNLLSKRFRVIKLFPFGYFPFFIFNKFENLCKKVERNFLGKVPLLNIISVSYITICVKHIEKNF